MPNARSHSYSREIIGAVIRGYASGLSQRGISDVLGIPRTTLREWVRDYRSGKLIISVEIPRHSHYWVVPPPSSGMHVNGTCKVCFMIRGFSNEPSEVDIWRAWQGDRNEVRAVEEADREIKEAKADIK